MGHKSTTEPPHDLDDRLGELFAVAPDQFVTKRNALAADLKRAGRAADSARVKGLTRPTLPAWAVNQVYWHAREDYERLTVAGDRMRELQRRALSGAAVDLHGVTKERQQAIRAFVDRASSLMRQAGQTVTAATRQRIAVTADAIAAYGSHPREYALGRLERDLDPPGFEALAGLTGAAPPPLRLVKSKRDQRDEEPAPGRASRSTGAPAETQSDREAARRRREDLKEATRARDASKRELDRARRTEAVEAERLEELQQELAPLRHRVALLEARAQKTEESLAASRKEVQEAERRWKVADQQVRELGGE